jgi:hypothetical protein
MYFLFEKCDAEKGQQFVIAENVNEAEYLFGELDEEEEE